LAAIVEVSKGGYKVSFILINRDLKAPVIYQLSPEISSINFIWMKILHAKLLVVIVCEGGSTFDLLVESWKNLLRHFSFL
jgi:hypothetical protein